MNLWRFAPRSHYGTAREPINIAPEVRDRLRGLLFQPEMRAVGYSAFLDRACELCETELMEARRGSFERQNPQ